MAYTDLTLIEWSATDLVARAVSNLKTRFPDWTPLEGSIEALLLEEFAKMTSETVWAANQAPSIVMQSLLLLYGVTRDPGAQAHLTLRFSLAPASVERTIPAATRVLVAGLVVTTDTEVTAAADATTVDAAATSEDLTAALNGQTGATVTMLDAVAYVDSVALVDSPHDGRDPEDLSSYLDRGSASLATLTSTLVRADQFATAALTDPNVSRAVAVDLFDPNQNPPTNRAGHLTVAVLGPNGVRLTADQKAAIETNLESQAVAILDVHIMDATVVSVDIAVDVHPLPGWVAADVKASITKALTSYLDAGTWAYGATVYVNELIPIIDAAPGVDRVIALTTPANDVALAGIGAVASLGALTVSVDGTTV